ncbi:ketoacyl reductase [Mixta theicola]|uniref:3-oxoacyl-[acyl-carrier-protein] reductase FabG n=1 Tax=Mixta theicola TaxID=1458355 RepID=A0A2K1Q7S1_9GAMM|nr:SDR family NAD(P)-dependent oxidoreductase [Mixta theicola]PNS11082.1 ketoacyl reductase [Mixta theicola]GLR08429.1 putative ketoacyl reductase [Mixta theicola]
MITLEHQEYKRVLITGATGGIGKSIAQRLCQDGFSPILVARSAERLMQLARDLSLQHPHLDVISEVCDVSVSADVRDLFKRLEKREIMINVLVNGAGISGGGITSMISDELWLNVINTNMNGMFYFTRELLRLAMMPYGGRIINIASTGGKQGVIHGAPYCASKHGMVGFSKSLGLELARNNSGITVNAICPGFVETDMAERVREHYAAIWGVEKEVAKRRVEERIPLGRYITADEVAAMVSYIASPVSSGITAQAINVCGGLGNY